MKSVRCYFGYHDWFYFAFDWCRKCDRCGEYQSFDFDDASPFTTGHWKSHGYPYGDPRKRKK